MEPPLAFLNQRAQDDWLIGCDSHRFTDLAQQLLQELTQLLSQGMMPKILLIQSDPVEFLAGFMAACATGCPVFLGNPGWETNEWKQVFALIQPNLIWAEPALVSRLLQVQQRQVPRARGHLVDAAPAQASKGWIMIPTGGSSGKIQFAIHTWETLMASVQGFQKYFSAQAEKLTLQINSFCVLPLYHVSGLMQFIRSFTSRGRLAVLPFKALISSPGYDRISSIWGDKRFSRRPCQRGTDVKWYDADPTDFFLSLVPTQLQRLLQIPALLPWLSHFQTVFLGGGPAWAELLAQARQHQIRLALTYGMTETASQIATLKPEVFLSGHNSCGQVLPHATVTIRSSDGRSLGQNQIGKITIEAESLALGYYPEALGNQAAFQLDDLGFFDMQGYLHVVGRSSRKIITGGENVFPTEVEAAIRATTLVTDVCVIGVPDQNWGQVVTAIYVPCHPELGPSDLQNSLKGRLSAFKQPKCWISVASLPRNSQGKVNYEQLQTMVISNLLEYHD